MSEEGAAKDAHYLLIWFSHESISREMLIPTRHAIEDQVKELPENVSIDLWLESPGGDAHTAFKLALLLRHHAHRVRVVIPEYAKSAATLLALAGHEVFMAPSAELGPLDAQLPDEGSLEGMISALNIARAADEVARDAVDLAGVGGADLLALTGLGRAETLRSMLEFSAKFHEPLVRQLDPKSVHNAKQMLRVTQRYAMNLLSPLMGLEKARHVAKHLVEDFPSHGFVISVDDADKLHLPVQPMVEYEYVEQVRGCHRAFEQGFASTVMFGPIESVVESEASEEVSENGEGKQAEEIVEGGDSVASAPEESTTLRAVGEGA